MLVLAHVRSEDSCSGNVSRWEATDGRLMHTEHAGDLEQRPPVQEPGGEKKAIFRRQ